MAIQLSRVGVTADLHVHVPRDERGTLVDGARAVVARIDGVESVDAFQVTSVRADLNAVATDVRVELTLAVDDSGAADSGAVADALRDGVGVQRAEVHDVGPPD